MCIMSEHVVVLCIFWCFHVVLSWRFDSFNQDSSPFFVFMLKIFIEDSNSLKSNSNPFYSFKNLKAIQILLSRIRICFLVCFRAQNLLERFESPYRGFKSLHLFQVKALHFFKNSVFTQKPIFAPFQLQIKIHLFQRFLYKISHTSTSCTDIHCIISFLFSLLYMCYPMFGSFW